MLKISDITFADVPMLFAISGGVDSMVLLDAALKKLPKNHIFVAHFNHNLRGEESDGDEIFVKNYCEEKGIAFFSTKEHIAEIAKKEKESIEATARKYRYKFFAKIYEKTKSMKLVTAHHLDDRIETAIFNLIRGTKFSGLYALRESESREIDGKMIILSRPFLKIPKSEILAYAKENNIAYREDSTNSDTTFQRNFLRHEILPKFETINGEYRKAINNFIEYIEAFSLAQNVRAVSWLTKQSEKYNEKREKFEEKNDKKILHIFSISDCRECDALLQFSIFERLYKWQNHGSIGLSE